MEGGCVRRWSVGNAFVKMVDVFECMNGRLVYLETIMDHNRLLCYVAILYKTWFYG